MVNGVLDIEVDIDLSSIRTSNECMIAADGAISSASYDLGFYTYTMYICPDEVDFGPAVGVANVNGPKSWYFDKYGSMPFVQMHEFGYVLTYPYAHQSK